MNRPFRHLFVASLAIVSSTAAAQQALPLKHAPEPTKADITAADLMTRLYIFADDSMLGRQIGTDGNMKGTAYLGRERRRMGLKPAGDSGGYFQWMPFFSRTVASATLNASGKTLAMGTDFTVALPQAGQGVGYPARAYDGAQVVFGGVVGDSTSRLSREQAAGKFVVFKPAPPGAGRGGGRGGRGGPAVDTAIVSSAAGVGIINAGIGQGAGGGAGGRGPGGGGGGGGGGGRGQLIDPASAPRAATFQITPAAAEALLGGNADNMAVGAAGARVSGALQLNMTRLPARNVVAIYPGTDPKLKNQYVAVGAHSDHVGFVPRALDHDSVHVYNSFTRVQGLENRQIDTTQSLASQARAALDSVRKLRPARMDSINNGADDDGSGSVVALELAEKFATGKMQSKRSVIFVWHTGEEAGLLGSIYFTDHPTVTRDSIVAQINMDMVGRGGPRDVSAIAQCPPAPPGTPPGPPPTCAGARTYGAPNYVELVGTRRISTELGDLVESINKKQKTPFVFDYQYDAIGHPQRIYCRSDHANYARYNIPVAYFTTGLQQDYHQVSDEPQYIDYEHMARTGNLVFDVTFAVANLDHRPMIDHPAVFGAPCS